MSEEVSLKLDRLREFLADSELEGVVLTRQANFSWILAGAENIVVRGADPAFAWALVTPAEAYVCALNNEARRLVDEEGVEELGFELRTVPWWRRTLFELAGELCPRGLAHDGFGPGVDVTTALRALRLELTAPERQRFLELGTEVCEVVETCLMDESADGLRTMTERDLAGRLVARFEERGILTGGLLIGGGARRKAYRHPTVSNNRIGPDVLVAVVGIRGGLHVAVSRTASCGAADADLGESHRIACEIEGALVQASTVGARWCDALATGLDVYADRGYPNEWREHAQGGPIGYGDREFVVRPAQVAGPESVLAIRAHQAYAWNPTVRGAKSEDTFLVGDAGPVPVSNGERWPLLDVESGPPRPAILEL
jgi:Xaa-Pro dipeptidase